MEVKLNFQPEPPSSPEILSTYRAFGLPTDFFEASAQSAALFNPLGIMERVPQKSFQVAGLETGQNPCPKNSGLYMYNPATGRSMTLPCKSRTCPACGKFWATNWQNRLGWNEFFNKDDKALTLTSACDPGFKAFWLALKIFWRDLRNYCHVRPELLNKETGEYRPKLFYKQSPAGVKRWMELKQKKLAPGGEMFKIIRPFRKIEYFGVVEYNQNHTQPHFHFVLRSGYIPQKVIKRCWQRAQAAAKFEKVAFDVRVEKIASGVKQYFFKYITKMADAKDELPRPDQWKGRGVRYSRAFFAAVAPVMNAAINLARKQTTDDYSKFHSLHSRTTPILVQKLDADHDYAAEMETVLAPWSPDADQHRANSPPIFPTWGKWIEYTTGTLTEREKDDIAEAMYRMWEVL